MHCSVKILVSIVSLDCSITSTTIVPIAIKPQCIQKDLQVSLDMFAARNPYYRHGIKIQKYRSKQNSFRSASRTLSGNVQHIWTVSLLKLLSAKIRTGKHQRRESGRSAAFLKVRNCDGSDKLHTTCLCTSLIQYLHLTSYHSRKSLFERST